MTTRREHSKQCSLDIDDGDFTGFDSSISSGTPKKSHARPIGEKKLMPHQFFFLGKIMIRLRAKVPLGKLD